MLSVGVRWDSKMLLVGEWSKEVGDIGSRIKTEGNGEHKGSHRFSQNSSCEMCFQYYILPVSTEPEGYNPMVQRHNCLMTVQEVSCDGRSSTYFLIGSLKAERPAMARKTQSCEVIQQYVAGFEQSGAPWYSGGAAS
jgi:hypothetical protein